MALLRLALQWRAPEALIAFTVDHGLRPEAQAEAEFVKASCLEFGVPHETLVWTPPVGDISQARARDARHRLLASALRKKGGSHLLLGHTLDDQFETVKMRSERGETGLAGMRSLSVSPVWPEGRDVFLARPLLASRRTDLREFLRASSQDWVEDPSNSNLKFERIRTRQALAMKGRAEEDTLRVTHAQAVAVREKTDRKLAIWFDKHVEAHEDGLIVCQPAGLDASEFAAALGHLLLVASGSDKPAPLQGRLGLAREILDTPESWRSRTLGGAWLALRHGDVHIARDPGLVPAGTAPIGTVWDGRFELSRATSTLKNNEKSTDIDKISALARRSYPVFSPSRVIVKCLARGRLDGIIKVLGHETCVYAC